MTNTVFQTQLAHDVQYACLLEATAQSYLDARSNQETPPLPLLQMLRTGEADLKTRAEALGKQLDQLPIAWSVGDSIAQVGGGTMPKSQIPSITLDLRPRQMKPEALAARLRKGPIPVVGYVADDGFRLDLRTIFPRQDGAVVKALQQALR